VDRVDSHYARTQSASSGYEETQADTEEQLVRGKGSLDVAGGMEAFSRIEALEGGLGVHAMPSAEVPMIDTTNHHSGPCAQTRKTKNAIRLKSPRRFRPTRSADVSSAMKLAQQVQDLPDVRWELVRNVREEIAAGTYETPERIEATVEILLKELLGE